MFPRFLTVLVEAEYPTTCSKGKLYHITCYTFQKYCLIVSVITCPTFYHTLRHIEGKTMLNQLKTGNPCRGQIYTRSIMITFQLIFFQKKKIFENGNFIVLCHIQVVVQSFFFMVTIKLRTYWTLRVLHMYIVNLLKYWISRQILISNCGNFEYLQQTEFTKLECILFNIKKILISFKVLAQNLLRYVI